jgi:hypothetical protein
VDTDRTKGGRRASQQRKQDRDWMKLRHRLRQASYSFACYSAPDTVSEAIITLDRLFRFSPRKYALELICISRRDKDSGFDQEVGMRPVRRRWRIVHWGISLESTLKKSVAAV